MLYLASTNIVIQFVLLFCSKYKQVLTHCFGWEWFKSEKLSFFSLLIFFFVIKIIRLNCIAHLWLNFQDDEDAGFNTSDEEFERQLEEASIISDSKAEANAGKRRTKRTKAKKKKTKTTSKFPDDGDGEGYEVVMLFLTFHTVLRTLTKKFPTVFKYAHEHVHAFSLVHKYSHTQTHSKSPTQTLMNLYNCCCTCDLTYTHSLCNVACCQSEIEDLAIVG